MVEIRINDDSSARIMSEKKAEQSPKETVIVTRQRPAKPRPAQIVKKETIIIKEKTKKPKRKNKKAGGPKISQKTINELMAVMRANQQLVDEMIKVNTGIMENVVRLSSSVASLTEKINSFLVKERREELPSGVKDEMEEKLDHLERKLNNIITSLTPRQ